MSESPRPVKTLPDGRGVWVYPQLFGNAKLAVGPLGAPAFDDGY